ncbi:MAG: CPBP family glutamic-type intramembrane protease [Planctomycetaceae bacterium]
MTGEPSPSNRSLALPFLLPYVAYVAVASIPADWLGREANYGIRILLAGAALAWGWRRIGPLRGPRSPLLSVATGAGVGLLGTVLWILLLLPFVTREGDAWAARAFWLRFAAAGLLVPLFEELAMRGYVLRVAVQWGEARRAGSADPLADALERRSLRDLAPGAATLFAVTVSTLLFALGHNPREMPAAVVYGLLMAGLWITRKDLLSCIAAHAATNLSLALYARSSASWGLW